MRREATDERLFPTFGRFEKEKREEFVVGVDVRVIEECTAVAGDEAGSVERRTDGEEERLGELVEEVWGEQVGGQRRRQLRESRTR